MSAAPKLPPMDDPFAQALKRAMHTTRNTQAQAQESPELSPEPTPEQPVTLPSPVGSGDYVIKKGDCLSSIAAETGLTWQRIWNDAGNAEVRTARKDPNVLAEGDRLVIPELRQKTEAGQTEMVHRFVRTGQPTIFRLRVADNGVPLGNRPFKLDFDRGDSFSNATNSDGYLEAPIPPLAKKGTLRIEKGDSEQTYELVFGGLEPVKHLPGIQQRLQNLGFYAGPIDGALSKRLTRGLRAFQRRQGLKVTGQPDADTCERLEKEHGS